MTFHFPPWQFWQHVELSNSMFIPLAWAKWISIAVFMDMQNAEHVDSRFWKIVESKMACCHIRLW